MFLINGYSFLKILKAFTSTSEKQIHVKMCGFSHGLTPQQLIEASKLQAKQEEERLALGLPSPQIVQNSKDCRKVGLRLSKHFYAASFYKFCKVKTLYDLIC